MGQVNPPVTKVKVTFLSLGHLTYDFVHLLDKGRCRSRSKPSQGAFFILQLHDELIYEVAEEDIIQVCRLLLKNEFSKPYSDRDQCLEVERGMALFLVDPRCLRAHVYIRQHMYESEKLNSE